MTRYVLITCLLLLAAPLRADDKTAAVIAPYLDDQAVMVLHVDLTKFDLAPVFDHFRKLGAPDKELRTAELTAKTFLDQLTKSGLKQAFVVSSLADLPNSFPLIVIPMSKEADEKLLRMFAAMLDTEKKVKFEKKDDLLLVGSERALRRARDGKAIPRPELARAFSAAGESSARLVVFANDTVRRAIEELAPTLPEELGGGEITVLTRGVRWLALGVNIAPAAEMTLVLQAADEAAAKALQGVFTGVFRTLGKQKEVRRVYPDFDKVTTALTPKLQGNRLTLAVKQELMISLAAPALQQVRNAATRSFQMNNLKQIGIAFHSYHDVNQRFPAYASFDKQGKPLLSWRVHLLPYLDQEKLYKQFKLDEPWDGAHNKPLIKKMPRVFASSANANLTGEGRTTFVVATGEGTAFAGKEGIALSKVTDGLSNTILVLDADDEHAVVWTKPEDLSVDLKAPARGLRKVDDRGYLVLMMDGSVLVLSATIDPKQLAARITPTGGEPIE